MIAARVSLVIFGCAALLWGSIAYRIFWQQSAIARTASQIIDGDRFKAQALLGQIANVETVEEAAFCSPTGLRSVAIVRLRIMEETLTAGERQLIDGDMNSLQESIRRALQCSPADPFLWLVINWVESTRNGFRADYWKYLRISYQLGPNEGWIALKRNHVAFSVFEQLPYDLAEKAINEFVGLLGTGLYDQVAEIFTGPAWRVRDQILPRLGAVEERDREAFEKALYRRGYEVSVPGIDRTGQRPWR